MKTIFPAEYLQKKNISYREVGNELVTACLFNGCDDDSRPNEAHLYFNKDTGVFYCQKCGHKGNLFTLARYFHDGYEEICPEYLPKSTYQSKKQALRSNEDELCHQNLPSHIRSYLNERGIDDIIIDDFKIGYGEYYGKNWITIPIRDKQGKLQSLKLRQDPWDKTNPNKYQYFPSGTHATIFPWNILQDETKQLLLCEGEFDALAALSQGISAVSSTSGAGTFKEEWLSEFAHVQKIYVTYDNDDAGKKGAVKVLQIMKSLESDIYQIELPSYVGIGGDITDFFVKSQETAEVLFDKYARYIDKEKIFIRQREISEPRKTVEIQEWSAEIEKHYPDLKGPCMTVAAILVQLLIHDISNPFALVLTDTPASGKTTTLNIFSDVSELVYVSDKFTPAAFVSHAANVKKEKLSDVDLLPRIKDRMMIVKDLGVMFSKSEEDLRASLGILTRVLDGEGLQTDGGVHGRRGYSGDYLFMFLAASTPLKSSVMALMGNLGARLFFLGLHSKEKSDDELVNQLLGTSWKQKERACKAVTQNFIYTLFTKYKEGIQWESDKDVRAAVFSIVRYAKILARLRATVNAPKKNGDDLDIPFQAMVEKPDRINQLLYNLARGHAVLHGRNFIIEDDLAIIERVVFDSGISERAKLMKALIASGGQLNTSDIMSLLKVSKPTALKHAKIMHAVGLCTIEVVDREFQMILEDQFLEGELSDR